MIRISQQILEIHCLALLVASSRKSLDHRAPATKSPLQRSNRFYDAPVSLEYAREYQIAEQCGQMRTAPQRLLLPSFRTVHDQTSKLIDSSATEALSSCRYLSLPGTKGVITTNIYGSRRPRYQHDRYLLRQPLCQHPLLQRKNGTFDPSLYSQIGSYVNDGFPRYDHVLTKRSAPAFQIT